MIRTVAGDVDTISGRILPHEHLQIDLSAQTGEASRLGAAEEPDIVEDLRKAKVLGLAAVTDLSAPGWGRDLRALRRIGEGAGVHVVAASGFYWDPYPDIAVSGRIESIRDQMIAEITTGVDGSGIRCGLIKVGTSRGEPGEPAEKLFRAAALAAMATGVPVITHTSTPDQAPWHVRVLEGAGMDMRRVVISHMGAAQSVAELVEVGRAGVFMGIDKVSFPKGPTNVQLADLVRAACDKGLAPQLLLSSDVARKTFLQRHGGRSYSTVFADFLPMLRERGLSPALIESLICDNPRRMLTLAA